MNIEPLPPLALFSASPEHDFPLGEGENDNYGNQCMKCGHQFRGHKRALVCRKCHEAGLAEWKALTPEEQQARHTASMEAAARYFDENAADQGAAD